jgi:uracil-DNA glycosylase
MTPFRYAFMANGPGGDWETLRANVKGQCSGCPRNHSKIPVIFPRRDLADHVDFIIVSQEPGYWLRPSTSSDDAERKLETLCSEGTINSKETKLANPLSKILQIFGSFDPTLGRVYWTHALKCIPTTSDRDINKEWRKAAIKCSGYFLEELRSLGKAELNILAFGKFALELCLNVFEAQDIDQELSISEFMQSSRLPLVYKYKFKDGTAKTVNLFVFTNPSSEVVRIKKSGGRMSVEEIQELETKRIKEIMEKRKQK